MSKEEVLLMHEDEVSIIYASILASLKDKSWDLNDDSDWSQVCMLKRLADKIQEYLDYGRGDDVRILDECQRLQPK